MRLNAGGTSRPQKVQVSLMERNPKTVLAAGIKSTEVAGENLTVGGTS